MTTPRYGTLFHFTHVDNLPAILDSGVLLSDTLVVQAGLLATEAGDRSIKTRRRGCRVTCGPGGVVADYVPFYFAARSPMMLSISRGRVSTFVGHHHDLLYLVSDVATMLDRRLPFVVSDRNAATAIAEFSDDPARLGDLDSADPACDFIDWSVMNLTYWNRTPEYPDRMERRMAEFLVYGRVPITAILRIGVHSDVVRRKVEHVFAAASWGLRVACEPSWYYA